MHTNQFFHNVCFGDNGYRLTELDLNEFIVQYNKSLDLLYNEAKNYESSILITKFKEHIGYEKGNEVCIISTEKFKDWLFLNCSMWTVFMNKLRSKLSELNVSENTATSRTNDYKHYFETNRTPFALPFIDGYFQKTEPELKILYYRLTELLNKTFDAVEFNKIKFGTIEQFNKIIKVANETNKPQHEAIFKDYVNELNKFEYTKPFKLTDSEIKEIRKKTQRLDDFQIFNLILEFVEKTAFEEFNQMQIEELNNLKEPNQKIIFNEMAKKQIINDFKIDIEIQNTVLNISPNTAKLSSRIALMIDWKIWEIYKNSLTKKDLNINQPKEKGISNLKLFPFINVIFRNVPNNHKNLYLIAHNVEYIFAYLELKKKSNFIKGYYSPHITFNSFKEFSKLVNAFADEVANNIEDKKLNFRNLSIKCNNLNDKINDCISLIDKYKEEFFNVEMHDPYFDKDCNWYKLIYTELKSIQNSVQWYLTELRTLNKLDIKTDIIKSNIETRNENNQIEKFILEEFNNMHKDNWKYAFINESDFLKFVKILTCYCQDKQYDLPNEPIKLKRGCKTVLSRVFNPIHKEFKTIVLKHDKEYFKIIRVLEHFNKLSNADIYRDITR